MIRALLIAVLSSACLPTLADRQCYGNDECMADQVCRAGTCEMRGGGGEDAEILDGKAGDARADAEPIDASDAGPEDAPVDAGPCVPGCADAVTLRECSGSNAIDTICDWGCSATLGAHCALLQPSGGAVMPADLVPDARRLAVTLVLATTLDSDTGAIDGVRSAGTGIIDGIEFVVRNNVGIFIFDELSVNTSLALRGTNAIALVSSKGIAISGNIDAQGDCIDTDAGPGGGRGGQPEMPGEGSGGGTEGIGSHDDCSGASGGGHGAIGGAGGASPSETSPPGGAIYGDAEISTLAGGSGGAGGGGPMAGAGGGGGGALQLAANRTIAISAGGINAGGCGGGAAPDDGGGGGGSGGTILIEARTIAIGAGAVLAVNGGGGGGGDGSNTRGEPGLWSRMPAAGGPVGDAGGAGGAGGAADALAGEPGGDELNGGGGGGAVGRIRLNTSTGTVATDPNAVISPGLDDAMTTATRGAASVF